MGEDLKSKIESLDKRIEFVKYHFTDMQGNIREVTLTRDNVSSTGSTSVDGSSIFGKIIPPTESDMMLIPDPTTLFQIPWEEDTARVICNVYYPPEKEGNELLPFEGCPRSILASVEKSIGSVLGEPLQKRFKGKEISKLHAHFAPEVEFILVPSDYDLSRIHLDDRLRNDHYFIPPKPKQDAALKEMLRAISKMGLKKEKYHTEVTTNQYEIGIGHGNVLHIADATMTLRYIIENVAQRHKLTASFIPKFKKGVNGSGMHVHQNLAATIDGKEFNLFFDSTKRDCLSDIGSTYIAGLLKYAEEITAVTNPLPISYKRLVPGCEAPTYIAWDWLNRTALCRGHSKGTHKIRVEYRAPDPKCNPYLAFAAMLSAGLEGIDSNLKLQPSSKRNFYKDNKGVKELPGDLGEALEKMNESKMLRKRMGRYIIEKLHELGKSSWKDYNQEVSDVDIRRYL
jgi:glutamine synthetase